MRVTPKAPETVIEYVTYQYTPVDTIRSTYGLARLSEEIVFISFEIPNPLNQVQYMNRMSTFNPDNNIKGLYSVSEELGPK
jgi:hypothetical protein